MTQASDAPSIPEQFEAQSSAFGSMGSPLMAFVASEAAADYRDGGPMRAFFDAYPEAGNLSLIGLRLMGALHFFALSGAAPELAMHLPSCGGDGDVTAFWKAARAFVGRDARALSARFAVTPQTNEVGRSMPLLVGLLTIASRTALPVRLFEVAASAGLNTRLDRYRYENVAWSWGDPASPLVLRNVHTSGLPKHLGAALRIVERGACDLHPLDIDRDEDRLTLRSYIWADQPERLDRLDRAIAAASALPIRVERADMFEWIPRNVAARNDAVTVVMHSIVMEHLAGDARERLRKAIFAAGAAARDRARVAWLRLERGVNTYETCVTLWPGLEEIAIARSDGHAQNLEWVESA